jgi:hypothetical protein
MYNLAAVTARSRWTPALLLLVAICERMAWSFLRPGDAFAGEAENVALALARGAGFADAYFVGSGPTAHLMPTTPVLAGIVFIIFGSLTPISNFILAFWAIAQMVINYSLLFLVFERLESPKVARLAGLAGLCLLPVFLGQENLDFRYWEGGLALMFCLMSLLTILHLQTKPIQPIDVIKIALLADITFFLNPIVGLTIHLCAPLLIIDRFSLKSAIYPIVVTMSLQVALLAPWTIRNYVVMGHPIVLRDNLGLELSVANNDLAATWIDHKAAFNQEMRQLHPSNGGFGRERLLEVGEYVYLKELQHRAFDWILNNPVAFARLCLRHLRQLYFPDAWQFEIGSGTFSTVRAASVSFVSAFGLLGLLAGLFRNAPKWKYVTVIVIGIGLLYVPFQPMARYLYLIYGFLGFSAADVLFRMVRRFRDIRSKRNPVIVVR